MGGITDWLRAKLTRETDEERTARKDEELEEDVAIERMQDAMLDSRTEATYKLTDTPGSGGDSIF
jgi:hypothetical protein